MLEAATIIYDSRHIRVIHRPSRSPFALITFSHATQFVKDLWFWGKGVAEKSGLETIGIVAYTDNWFPLQAMQEAAPIIRATLARHSQIVGFGTSMGGYGALRYGRLLGMTHSLAFVPQWSIDPADVGSWDARFVRCFDPTIHDQVAIGPGDVAASTAIIYDPFMKHDRMNFDRILATNPECVGIKAYCTGHSSIETFRGAKPTTDLMRLLVDRDFPTMQRLTAKARRDKNSFVRPLALAQMMIPDKLRYSERILTAHAAKFTPRQKALVHHELACALYTKNAFSDALKQSLIANKLAVDRDFQIRLSMIWNKLGHSDIALDIANNVVLQFPGDNKPLLYMSALVEEQRKADCILERSEA